MIEENKLIAEFMGAKIDLACKDCVVNFHLNEFGYSIGNGCETFESLQFHKSWDWLMPCFSKLRLLGAEYKISENTCMIKTFISGYNSTTVFESTIESCHANIVEYIKWYNNQK